METKKSFKADLGNKRGLLLEIGLVVALVFVVAAFAYTPKEYRIEQRSLAYAPVVDVQMTEITREKPREAVRKVEIKPIGDVIQIVRNDRKIQTDIPFEEFDEHTPIELVPVEPEPIVDDEVFLVAETMPAFMNGSIETFRAWVMQNVKFPQIALENNIQGRVVLSFVIDKDGRLTNIEALQAPDRSLAEEAVRVLNKSPKWSPGKQRNQTVRVRFTLPVDFRVQN